MREKGELKDAQGNKIDFKFFNYRTPIEKPSDKAIMIKLFLKVSEVEAAIKELMTYERCPNMSFNNPKYLE